METTPPGGMLVFKIFGSLAQFERDLIRERTQAGLRAARERGSKGGRRPVVTPDKLRKARAHIAAGRSEEHTSELQSLMRISYAVFCLKKKKKKYQMSTAHITLVTKKCHTK